jgi:endonuclease YncB( thermonuclease family)
LFRESLKVFALVSALYVHDFAHADEISGRPRVVDGDTLAFGDSKIRLQGVDAPELHQVCQDRAGKAYRCGKVAAAALIGKIADGVLQCSGEHRDRYRRLLATCWKGTEDLNQWMVLNGWALAFRRYSTVYVDAEDAARLANRGLWAGDFDLPWDWRRVH